jgi:hypothetical protein
MYFAVYLGGLKWVKLIPGKNCGQNCVNAIKTASGKPGIRFRKADYTSPILPGELTRLADELSKDPDAFSLEQLEARAQALRPSSTNCVAMMWPPGSFRRWSTALAASPSTSGRNTGSA